MIPATKQFSWNEYLRLATDLAQNQDEASHRTSISRAYYSVFHAATIQAKQNGYSGGSHKEIWATYQKDSDRNCKRLSTIGNQMRVARNAADYDATVPDIPDVMAQQLKYANKFMAMLATLPSTSPQP